ncbi:MAG: succinate dehydrogenase, hydrophobic membrane anchor protein [Nisaea sp.]|jgi:succinate dehydrogenase / fumarate reductase membrane anchor subunit|uniref:succinate dehydrogenase, hydrophobic membrane anchor protein n=1 Tax=Nisaea sp. TaxID=2024842 RepID=UPI001B179874|nr:succinate dehydrogenase, hydrophobic membrane anchor protein [Nisaea sp.]MBO6559913.1 succinate dehydrogenase, hydrophobic membrane anchor protein [Nisaea sp.]
MTDNSMRTPIGRVRGLGSAKAGLHHWWMQRITAIALIPLTLWFVASLISLAGAGYEETAAWLGSPFVAILMIALIVATFYHAALGLQVVIEDYIHHEGAKLALLLGVKLLAALLAIAALFAVLKLAFGG